MHVQKRLLQRKVYYEFKEKFPDRNLGFLGFGQSTAFLVKPVVHIQYNTSKCKADDGCDTAIGPTNIPPLLSKDLLLSE